jgi:hypothetical protein
MKDNFFIIEHYKNKNIYFIEKMLINLNEIVSISTIKYEQKRLENELIYADLKLKDKEVLNITQNSLKSLVFHLFGEGVDRDFYDLYYVITADEGKIYDKDEVLYFFLFTKGTIYETKTGSSFIEKIENEFKVKRYETLFFFKSKEKAEDFKNSLILRTPMLRFHYGMP